MTTAPPSTPVEVCNLALDYIGEKPIASIEAPTSTQEETMLRWYDHVRLTVLREYVWNFAQQYATLARSGDGDAQYADAYLLPNDCVRVNTVGSDRYNPITCFDIIDRTIHASEGNSLNIWYNRSVTEVTYMDSLFVNIFALRLALKVAYKFTKKKSVVEMVSGMLAAEESKAASVDGQERPPRRIQHSKYLTARKQGGVLGRDNRYYSFS